MAVEHAQNGTRGWLGTPLRDLAYLQICSVHEPRCDRQTRIPSDSDYFTGYLNTTTPHSSTTQHRELVSNEPTHVQYN